MHSLFEYYQKYYIIILILKKGVYIWLQLILRKKRSKTSGQETLDNPEYNKTIKELYGKIIYTLNGLNSLYCPSFSKEKFISLVKELVRNNEYLADEYYNKYLISMRESDEIYRLYESTIQNNEDKFNQELLMLDEKLKIKFAKIEGEISYDCTKKG